MVKMKNRNSIMPEDYEEFIIKNARKKLETPMAPAMHCKTSKKCKHGDPWQNQ